MVHAKPVAGMPLGAAAFVSVLVEVVEVVVEDVETPDDVVVMVAVPVPVGTLDDIVVVVLVPVKVWVTLASGTVLDVVWLADPAPEEPDDIAVVLNEPVMPSILKKGE